MYITKHNNVYVHKHNYINQSFTMNINQAFPGLHSTKGCGFAFQDQIK